MPIPKRYLFVFAVSVVLSFMAGYFFSIFKKETSKTVAIREYDERYEFIRPLLICQLDEQTETKEYQPLERNIEQLIGKARQSGELADASVYFRDLNTGRWIGVNEEKVYSPASLLKVPAMISYFKQAEYNEELLQHEYLYNRKADDVNPLINQRMLKDGERYSIEELIRGMIIQSDNSAKDILISHAPLEALNETYVALGIRGAYATTSAKETYQISAKQYALFFRVLYNGTFLNREMSNRAIELMSQVQFDKGLRVGTPASVKVAHKYGIRATAISGQTAKVELSDCGIIYSKQSPYLLCVMTEGDNPYVLADVIKRVAETVYQQMSLAQF